MPNLPDGQSSSYRPPAKKASTAKKSNAGKIAPFGPPRPSSNPPRKTTSADRKDGGASAQRAVNNIAQQSGRVAPAGNAQQAMSAAANAGINNDTLAIMRASGSTNPADPYNWAGIAAALSAQGAPAGGGFAGGSSGGGGSSIPTTPAPVVQPPSQIDIPAVTQPPTGTESEVGPAAVSGRTFSSAGRGTFGSFDRLRNQRSPRSGLSVTPEMLRAAAQARMNG